MKAGEVDNHNQHDVNNNNLPQATNPIRNLVNRIWSVVKNLFCIVFPCLRVELEVFLYTTTEQEKYDGEKFLRSHCPYRCKLKIISTNHLSDTDGDGKRVLAVMNAGHGATEECFSSGVIRSLGVKNDPNRKALLLFPFKQKYAPLLRGPNYEKIEFVFIDSYPQTSIKNFFSK